MGVRPLRVGLIGARRVRQGLGPFFARDLVKAGAEVAAVLGRSAESAEAAAREAERWAAIPDGAIQALDTPEAFYGADLDAVCVLTPAGTHGEHVEEALNANCHVLAEKPFLWAPEDDWVARARTLEDQFAAAGLVLAVNAQWPFTIPALAESLRVEESALRRDGHPSSIRKLEMSQQPASTGIQMIGDAVPHPLSLAQALRPSLRRATNVTVRREDEGRAVIEAILVGEGSPLELTIHLEGSSGADSTEAPGPKSAWISVDGARVDRAIRRRDYAMFFARGADLVDLPDPLALRIQDFVRESNEVSGPREPDREISTRAAMLKSIADAFGASR